MNNIIMPYAYELLWFYEKRPSFSSRLNKTDELQEKSRLSTRHLAVISVWKYACSTQTDDREKFAVAAASELGQQLKTHITM